MCYGSLKNVTARCAFGPFACFVGVGLILMLTLWYYEDQHTAAATECRVTTPRASNSQSCPTKNIDVFIVAEQRSFALVEWTVSSIQLFMPCRGTLHIVCDPGETAKLLTYVGMVPDIKIHEMKRPKSLTNTTAFVMMQWPQFWADKYVSPTADYVMFMDSDSILTFPVTCRALFNPEGRIILPAWRWDAFPRFTKLCEEGLGKSCFLGFMNYFPFLFPVRLLGPLREIIVKNRNASNFNNAIWYWDYLTPSRNPPNSKEWTYLSQFIIMGNYLLFNHPELVDIPHCFPQSKQKENPNTICHDYIHPGLHYGWRPCRFLDECSFAKDRYRLFEGDGKWYTKKFSPDLMVHLVEVMLFGLCFMQSLAPSSTEFPSFPMGDCTSEMINTIHNECRTYQTLPVNMTVQRLKYLPDPFQHLCPSVHLRTPETKDYVETDNMMA